MGGTLVITLQIISTIVSSPPKVMCAYKNPQLEKAVVYYSLRVNTIVVTLLARNIIIIGKPYIAKIINAL